MTRGTSRGKLEIENSFRQSKIHFFSGGVDVDTRDWSYTWLFQGEA